MSPEKKTFYTKNMHFCASGRLCCLSALFFFLSEVEGFSLLSSHKSTCISILEIEPLPRSEVQILVLINGKFKEAEEEAAW